MIWIFVGAVFQWIYFRPIYEPARLFATWFGPFPCPVAVFTIGMLLLTDDKVPKYLAIIPLLWALGGATPLTWGVTEDIGLVAGGTIGIILLFVRDFRRTDATITT